MISTDVTFESKQLSFAQRLFRCAPYLALFIVISGVVLIAGDFTKEFFQPPTPKGLVGLESINLGAVSGDSVSGQVQLRNHNFSGLEIIGIDAGCSCTSATIEPKKLEHGESAILKFTINRVHRLGKVSQSIVVYYHNPKVHGIRHFQLVAEMNWSESLQPVSPVP